MISFVNFFNIYRRLPDSVFSFDPFQCQFYILNCKKRFYKESKNTDTTEASITHYRGIETVIAHFWLQTLKITDRIEFEIVQHTKNNVAITIHTTKNRNYDPYN
jgi:hypothetical protein